MGPRFQEEILFQKNKKNLERWLNSWECLLFFQRTWASLSGAYRGPNAHLWLPCASIHTPMALTHTDTYDGWMDGAVQFLSLRLMCTQRNLVKEKQKNLPTPVKSKSFKDYKLEGLLRNSTHICTHTHLLRTFAFIHWAVTKLRGWFPHSLWLILKAIPREMFQTGFK